MTAYVITHPEVSVDPDSPVTQWELSPAGRARLEHLRAMPWASSLSKVVVSAEVKAMQTAQALVAPLGCPLVVDRALGENDRSATGFVPPAEFEELADAFFARPEVSVRGWETASCAQERIVAAVRRAVHGVHGDVAVVAHGGVGTLLWCRLMAVAIDRRYDQPGQGSWFSFEPPTGRPHHGWRRLEPFC